MLFYLDLTITLAYAMLFADTQTKAQLGFSKAMLLVNSRLRFELLCNTENKYGVLQYFCSPLGILFWAVHV